MKYRVKLSVYPLKGFLPAQEHCNWIEDSELNTEALLKKLKRDALRDK